jgi:hypothetical protein
LLLPLPSCVSCARPKEPPAATRAIDETLGSPRDRQPKNRQTISIHYSGEKSQRLEIVSKVLSGDQPLVCVVLRIAGDHVANLGRAGLFVGHRYTDPSHVLAGLVGPQFCDLLATVLLKFHMFLFSMSQTTALTFRKPLGMVAYAGDRLLSDQRVV